MLPTAEQLDALVASLRVRPGPGNRFLGPIVERNLPRMFGGQILAQAIMAAGATVPDGRSLHSLHTMFLTGGDPHRTVTLEVDRVRDGRTYSARSVTAHQEGTVLGTLMLSFQATEDGPEHEAVTADAVPPPEELPTLARRLAAEAHVLPRWWTDPHPFDIRFVEHPDALAAGRGGTPEQRFWVRTAGSLPDDPLLHTALLAYVSDLTLLDPALMPHGRSWYGHRVIAGASIDHAMWFHRSTALDGWLLCSQHSPVATSGRCLCTCTFTDSAGHLVASAAQEGALREPRSAPESTRR